MPKLSSSTATATAAPASKKTVAESAPAAAETPAKSQKVKSETKKAAAPVVASETPAPTPTPTPKKKSAKPATASTPAVVAVTTEPAAAVAAAAESTPATAAAVVPAATDYSTFMTKLQLVSTMLSSLRGDFRSLEKKNSRDLKLANKANAKRARKQKGNRSPSGFVKPTLISVELATFLGKETGTQMARTEVTREINTYIRANSLQDKANGRKINADDKLSALLKLTAGEELTYFNLQRFMSPHFIKTTVPVVVA
jgi:hypothetical protein